jgi:hypothetical protein
MSGLEDSTVTSMAVGSSSASLLSDLYTLDFKSLYNRSISTFLIQYAMFYFDIDQQVFSPGDSDLMLAAKNTGVIVASDALGAWLRTSFPGLVM